MLFHLLLFLEKRHRVRCGFDGTVFVKETGFEQVLQDLLGCGMVSNVGVASNMVKAFNMGVASNMGMAFNISVANKREPEKQRKKRERSSDCNDGREKGVASNGVWVGERERE